MGIFDFLKGKMAPAAGGTIDGTMAMAPGVNPAMVPPELASGANVGPLQQAPVMQHQPGLLERGRMPDASGLSMADRILMGMMSLNGDTRGAIAYGSGKTQTTKDTNERARKNAAIKAAYVNGKFDPNAYMTALGDQGDATEALALAKELAPKTGVDGSFAYSIDPITGQVHWGEQRQASHAEEAQMAKEAEAERHAQEMEDYYRTMARAAMQNAGANEYRAHKPPASGGGSSWLPAGAHVIHIPGQ